MIGWMVMKQFGVSAIGSFQFDPKGMLKGHTGRQPTGVQYQLWQSGA